MPESNSITITINNKTIECQPGESIIAAADRSGIHIPRFCYHPKLSVVASCRMCLVDIEKSNKPLPACKTMATDGMIIKTKSDKAIEAQRAIMEFLLINHPLDCPICDQGGECELQDVSLGYGFGNTDYHQPKRVVSDEDLGPLIATDMTRCIHCSRCVRFGDEIAGMPELGLTGRGENTQISTYLKKSMHSELSGNVIDLCPVGALTSKPHRYHGRSWEYTQHHSISPHDCVGSHLYYHIVEKQHSNKAKVTRVVPRVVESVNQNWISNRDRFSYQALEHKDRLEQPMIKQSGVWIKASWEKALTLVNSQLTKTPSESIYGLVSPTVTTEEMYLFRQWLDSYGCVNFDHRLKEVDFQDQAEMPLYPGSLDLSLESIESMQSIFIVGGNTRHDAPLFNHRVRQAHINNQAKIHELNLYNFDLNYKRDNLCLTNPQQFAYTLAQWLDRHDNTSNCCDGDAITDDVMQIGQAIITCLKQHKNSLIVLGLSAQSHPQASQIRRIIKRLAKLTHSKLILITDGPNTAGAWITGMLPHRQSFGQSPIKIGQTVTQAWEQQNATYVLYQVEPDKDCFGNSEAVNAIRQSKFTVAFCSYMNQTLNQHADVLLPLSSHTENSGTFINLCGSWQSFKQAMPHLYNSRPGWVVLQKLCSMKTTNFPIHNSVEPITQQIKALYDKYSLAFTRIPTKRPDKIRPLTYKLMNYSYPPAMLNDALVRRALALNSTVKPMRLLIHPDTAKAYQLKDGKRTNVKYKDISLQLICEFDKNLAEGCIATLPDSETEIYQTIISHVTLDKNQDNAT